MMQRAGVCSRTFRPWMLRAAFGLAFLAALPLIVGCYGSFPITNMVYEFNGDVTDSELVHTIVFWLFLIVPVYKVAMLADAIVFNLVEFWTGADFSEASIIREDGTRVALTFSEDREEAILTASREGEMIQRVRFVRVAQGRFDVFDSEHGKIGQVIQDGDGAVLLKDEAGTIVRTISPGSIEAMRAAAERMCSSHRTVAGADISTTARMNKASPAYGL